MKKNGLTTKLTAVCMTAVIIAASGNPNVLGAYENNAYNADLAGFAPNLSETDSLPSDNVPESSDALSSYKNGAIDFGFRTPGMSETVISSDSRFLPSQAQAIPQSYSSVSKNYVTGVKNQGNMGICWAYTACAVMESYALSHGYVSDKNQIDLSEYALAYMTFDDSSYTDPLGGTDGDVSSASDMTYSMNTG